MGDTYINTIVLYTCLYIGMLRTDDNHI